MPSFYITTSQTQSRSRNGPMGNGLWGRFPAYDVLQLIYNEGLATAVYQDFKICFTGAQWLELE